jgi:hypothetical protein
MIEILTSWLPTLCHPSRRDPVYSAFLRCDLGHLGSLGALANTSHLLCKRADLDLDTATLERVGCQIVAAL